MNCEIGLYNPTVRNGDRRILAAGWLASLAREKKMARLVHSVRKLSQGNKWRVVKMDTW